MGAAGEVIGDSLTCCRSMHNTEAVSSKVVMPGGRDLDDEVLTAVKESIEAR